MARLTRLRPTIILIGSYLHSELLTITKSKNGDRCETERATTTRVRGNAENGETADGSCRGMDARSLSCGIGHVG